jgi:hypothetical protein
MGLFIKQLRSEFADSLNQSVAKKTLAIEGEGFEKHTIPTND